jgi:hypothetical protein
MKQRQTQRVTAFGAGFGAEKIHTEIEPAYQAILDRCDARQAAREAQAEQKACDMESADFAKLVFLNKKGN